VQTGSEEIIDMMQRVRSAERMSEIKSQYEALHVMAAAVVIYSSSGGRR
jgi:hypothetical protein